MTFFFALSGAALAEAQNHIEGQPDPKILIPAPDPNSIAPKAVLPTPDESKLDPKIIHPKVAATCALREPGSPRPRGLGTVLSIQDVATASADIPSREARRGGAIDPHYLNDQRVVVRQDIGGIDIYDLPAGATVRAGDRVKLQGSYRSSAAGCAYIPILAIPSNALVG